MLTELRPVFGEIIFESLELLERKDGITEIHSNTSKRTMFKIRALVRIGFTKPGC